MGVNEGVEDVKLNTVIDGTQQQNRLRVRLLKKEERGLDYVNG